MNTSILKNFNKQKNQDAFRVSFLFAPGRASHLSVPHIQGTTGANIILKGGLL
jgi:hypothetical protein